MKMRIAADEGRRLDALHDLAILDTPPEPAFERIAHLAARLFEVPIALVSLVDEDRQWFKCCIGLDATETPREVSFCVHAILSDEVMVVPDATRDDRFTNNPHVTGPPFIRFYAGAPLTTRAGHNLGTLCIIDTEPRTLSPDDADMLRDLAATVVDLIEYRAAGTSARAETEELRRRRAEIARSAALIELVHDVAVAANETSVPTVALQTTLDRVCRFSRASVAHA